MSDKELVFVIPTYRLRDVGTCVEHYDDNFHRNGYSVPLFVFDDSTLSTHEKYFPLLEQTHTHNEVFYVGPAEKAAFLQMILRRLHDRRLEPVVKNLFRPSYGGNRNFTLMYTLGSLMMSADDDMRPDALIADVRETLGEAEVCRGHLVKANERGFTKRSYDLVQAFMEVLGKRVEEAPSNYETGEYVVDSATDLHTNATTSFVRQNVLTLANKGPIPGDCTVKVVQTFRSGTSDVDAVDYVEMFLSDEAQQRLDELNDLYILDNFRPVMTKKNWRIDCGVAGWDNTQGLPPFFPTRLRFEDYIFRLWIQQPGVAAAHVPAAQNHVKSNYMRNPPSAEVFNEDVCNLIKRKIVSNAYTIDPLTLTMEYDGAITSEDTEAILERITKLYARVVETAEAARTPQRREGLLTFAQNLSKAYYGFESDFFHQNVARIVDDVISVFRGALELWPTLLEVVYFQKARGPLPVRRVNNR